MIMVSSKCIRNPNKPIISKSYTSIEPIILEKLTDKEDRLKQYLIAKKGIQVAVII